MIIDAHLHLNPDIDGTALGAAKELSRQLRFASINLGIVLQLQFQPWSMEEVSNAISNYDNLKAFVNIHPEEVGALDKLEYAIKELNYIGLKLHPRLQNFDLETKSCFDLVKKAGVLNVPTLICGFPDGTMIMRGFSPLAYANLAKECINSNIIWAHMGGHYVLDFMMLAKRLPNVYMDCSYSLLYYQGSPTVKNMIYAMKSMKMERIFYGSDYPDREIKETLDLSCKVLNEEGITESELHKLLYENANNFFNQTK
jgi:predicted TIM-barrel fold metal-dependent hydrolase